MKKEQANQTRDWPEEKKLVWKLKELPTAEAIADLVDTKVITPEEARDILFKEEAKQSDEVEALKEMVKTLQEMVHDLLSRQNNITLVPYTKVVEVPIKTTPYWDRYWTCTGTTTSSSGNTDGFTTYTLSM